jgi:hypothetical protein
MILPKWNRIGYVEGSVNVNDNTTLRVRSILFVRDPFLWFRTRKVVEIGDRRILKLNEWTSSSIRNHDMQVRDWLLGGKIDYISENGSSEPAKIIKLVK